MQHLWRNYSLSLVLGGLFVTAWILQSLTGWVEFQSEQRAHGEVAALWGADGYVWRWARATFENWESEFLQLLAFVVLTSWLTHRGSPESKDSDETLRAQLTRLEQQLARLSEGARSSAAGSGRTEAS